MTMSLQTQKLDDPDVSDSHGCDSHYGDRKERELPDLSQGGGETKDPERSHLGKSVGDESFIVTFDGDHDPMYPRNMSLARKWAIVITVCMGTVCV